MKKQVTLTFQGYHLDNVRKAVISQFFQDNPNATISAAARAMGVSGSGLQNMMKTYGLEVQPKYTKAEMAAAELLKRRGHTVILKEKPKAHRGRKPAHLDFSPLENPNGQARFKTSLSTVKRYARPWLKNQPDRVKLIYLEDAAGVVVKRA